MTIKSLLRLIICCWSCLLICFIIKICGGNYFEIVVNNDNFIKVCDFIVRHYFLKHIIYLILNIITNTIYLLAVCNKKTFNKYQFIWLIPLLVLFYHIKLLNVYLGLITDIIQVFILPFILGLKLNKWYRTIIGFILDLSFQYLSIIIKNLGFGYISDNFIIGIIYMIDYYIMIVLYYLYTILIKENEFNMGKWFLGLLSEEETQMQSYSKFKRFWIRVWRFLTFYKLRKKRKHNSNKNIE